MTYKVFYIATLLTLRYYIHLIAFKLPAVTTVQGIILTGTEIRNVSVMHCVIITSKLLGHLVNLISIFILTKSGGQHLVSWENLCSGSGGRFVAGLGIPYQFIIPKQNYLLHFILIVKESILPF